ncbi:MULTISPECIES: phospholipase D-like domain-containing protein [Roseateles]|uniref:Phospholipase D-like domain-containing protein n=1 Tax=Pelomonas caseinilytica TaxID=2906763 RepID=A0ABS8X740_9BURK|nr:MULTISPECIES: phospholipase D-like domain-containing protein [unclassified Roseateles]MCE4536329.1 phospholipase D-like domain-containing protein [Pelomonas sp. P7]HEV6968613.1 phospholipase D-like domain-containing protein [Roseateles sp.]
MKRTRAWRQGWVWALTTLLLLAGTAACGSLLERDRPVRPLSPGLVAQRVTLQDRDGPVPAAAEARELARVRDEGNGALFERHLGVLAAAGEAQLLRGNTARLLVDGPATFAAMKAAIVAARHRLFVEFYIVEDEGVAAEVGELLLRKAAEGVHVALMYDSLGSLGTERAFFDRLRQGGIAVCAFNPLNPLERPGHWGLVQRNHRKMLAADSDVAFTGGINLSNVYAEGSFGSARRQRAPADAERRGWRDTQVEVRGPVVGALAALFRESWERQGCEGELPPAPPPRVATPGQRVIKLVAGDPANGVNPSYTALLHAIDASQRSVQLTMAYFAPGREFIQALCDAARRGVSVALVLPGRSDVKMVLHAARARYAQLLEAGVQIHEMSGSVMHAKTAVIDGVYSSVGSSNLDWRSIVGNNEVDVIVLGDDFGQEMQALFARDLQVSRRIDAAQWSQRGLGERLLEGFARLVEPLL